jgi:2-haloalkanoic acid dehalogenase type II
MRLGDFAALTFDCYGTLIDWEQGILIELKPWVQKNGLTIGDDEILAAFAEIEPKYQAETPDKLYPDVLTAVYLDLGKRWRIPADFDDAVAFGQSVGRWPAFPDSTPSLRYLKRHYKLVILSNVDRASFAESNKKLGVSFDRIITAQDVGSYKPDPRNFEYLISELADMGIEKKQILHTAQSPFHDIAPAQAAGLHTAWVNRRKGKAGGGATAKLTHSVIPDFEVASLKEFVEMHQADVRA